MAKCANCGHELSETARFCTRCGTPMKPPTPPSEEMATRKLPLGERGTGLRSGRPTGPAYVPPEPGLYQPPIPLPAAPAEPESGTVNLVKWLSDGWAIYKRDPGTFSLAFLVMLLLSMVTLTVLTGPLMAGFYHMTFKSMRGEKPRVGDLFKGLDRFWPAAFAWFLYAAVLGALNGPSGRSPLFGLISFAVMPLVGAIYFFVYPLIMERQRDTAAAIDEAARVVFPKNVLLFWICGLLFEILSIMGVAACGIGVFVSAPVVLCAMAAAYRDVFGLAGPWSKSTSSSPWMFQDN